MNRNKLTFESENFQIHYLTLNMQFDDLKRIKKIADYFSNTFDCNSVFIDCKNSTQNCTLIKKERSLCKAEFRVNSQKYWYGTSLSFSGNQSTYFYKTIKGKGLDWEILDFDNTNLSRIDLYYDRKFKKGDEIENFDSFLEECCSQIEKIDKRKKVIIDKGVLRVGRRGSGNYFRVYRRPNGKDIRFELELTKSVVKNFASTIRDSCLNEEAFKNEEGSHKVKGVEKPAVIFSIEATQEKITFDKETGSFVSGQRVRLKSFKNYIGSIKNYPRQN